MTHLTKGQKTAFIDPKKAFRIHLLVFLLVIPINWIIWYFTDSTYAWPLLQTPLWATGVLFHYLGVFVFKKINNNKI